MVTWNSTEKSWDCPAHGSRFDAFGRAITGPACAGLEPMSLPAEPTHADDEAELDRRASEHREGLPLQ